MATRRLAPAAVQPESFAFTAENLIRTRQCVINLPGPDDQPEPGSGEEARPGLPARARKFGVAGLTLVDSQAVQPFGKNVSAWVFEVHVEKLHVDDALGSQRHIDPVAWNPLIMRFCRFFARGGMRAVRS